MSEKVHSKRSPFYKHFKKLFDEVKETKGEIFSKINKKGFIGYSSYSGLALEDNWNKKQNKINDLAFRCCLINKIINSIKG